MSVNCLSVRRTLSTASLHRSAQVAAHLQSCASCNRFAAQCAREERLLRQAVRTPVPSDLSASILMVRAFATRARRRVLLSSLAAGLACIITVATFVGAPLYREHQLTSDVLALVEAADYALENRDPLRPDIVQQALAPVGFSLASPLERVSFAGRCLVQGTLAGHLVVRDQQRPVTVFLIPRRELDRPVEFSDSTWSGVLLPEQGDGAIAVLAPRGTDMREVAGRVRAALLWPS